MSATRKPFLRNSFKVLCYWRAYFLIDDFGFLFQVLHIQ